MITQQLSVRIETQELIRILYRAIVSEDPKNFCLNDVEVLERCAKIIKIKLKEMEEVA